MQYHSEHLIEKCFKYQFHGNLAKVWYEDTVPVVLVVLNSFSTLRKTTPPPSLVSMPLFSEVEVDDAADLKKSDGSALTVRRCSICCYVQRLKPSLL